jgi:hypothetical protein
LQKQLGAQQDGAPEAKWHLQEALRVGGSSTGH